MTNQYTTKQTRWFGNAQVSKKRRGFLPEEKRVAKAIEYRISSRLKASYIWIKKNTRKDVLNYYYSVKMALGYVINPEFSNHKIIGCTSLFRATTSPRINTATKR